MTFVWLGAPVFARSSFRPYAPMPAAVLEVLLGMAVTGHLLVAAFHYRRRTWSRRLGAFPGFPAVAIASAPRGSAAPVTIEGRLRRIAATQDHAPLLGGEPCLYHRLVIERWMQRSHDSSPGWRQVHRRWRIEPFCVADASGFVLVEPVLEADPNDEYGILDPVQVDVEVFTGFAVHEALSGVEGLPAAVRAYLEANVRDLKPAALGDRFRVTEVVLRDGDCASVVGFVEERKVPAGSYREDGMDCVLAMAGFPRRLAVVPAPLHEVRWLAAFDRSFVIGLVGLAALCIAAVAFAMAR